MGLPATARFPQLTLTVPVGGLPFYSTVSSLCVPLGRSAVPEQTLALGWDRKANSRRDQHRLSRILTTASSGHPPVPGIGGAHGSHGGSGPSPIKFEISSIQEPPNSLKLLFLLNPISQEPSGAGSGVQFILLQLIVSLKYDVLEWISHKNWISWIYLRKDRSLC